MTMSTQKVKFVLAAEIVADASTGLLLGEFNNWDKESGFSLKKGKDGTMEATVALEAGRSYQYRYLLDGGRWENDHRADAYLQVEGHDVYNCVVHVSAAEAVAPKTAKKASVAKPKGTKIELPSATEAVKSTVKAKATAAPVAEKKEKPAAKASAKTPTAQKPAAKAGPAQKVESKAAPKAAASGASRKKSTTKGK
jgi:hypothetical protein